jgi:hypothetical protein
VVVVVVTAEVAVEVMMLGMLRTCVAHNCGNRCGALEVASKVLKLGLWAVPRHGDAPACGEQKKRGEHQAQIQAQRV